MTKNEFSVACKRQRTLIEMIKRDFVGRDDFDKFNEYESIRRDFYETMRVVYFDYNFKPDDVIYLAFEKSSKDVDERLRRLIGKLY